MEGWIAVLSSARFIGVPTLILIVLALFLLLIVLVTMGAGAMFMIREVGRLGQERAENGRQQIEFMQTMTRQSMNEIAEIRERDSSSTTSMVQVIAATIADSITGSVMEAWKVSFGSVSQNVQQVETPPDGDTGRWAEGNDWDGDPTDIGMVFDPNRPLFDTIAPGESIIPGIDLPDLSGETYS